MNKAQFFTRRRFMMATGSAFAVLGAQSTFAQRLKIESGEFQPIPIAIPNFVPGSPADGQEASHG